jgi:hypothetical protein
MRTGLTFARAAGNSPLLLVAVYSRGAMITRASAFAITDGMTIDARVAAPVPPNMACPARSARVKNGYWTSH